MVKRTKRDQSDAQLDCNGANLSGGGQKWRGRESMVKVVGVVGERERERGSERDEDFGFVWVWVCGCVVR